MTRPITIEPVLNGFVVQVGCQRVVFNNVEALCENIRKYYKNPGPTEKSFIEQRINNTMDDVPRVAPPRGEPLREQRALIARVDAEVTRPYTTESVCEPQCDRPR